MLKEILFSTFPCFKLEIENLIICDLIMSKGFISGVWTLWCLVFKFQQKGVKQIFVKAGCHAFSFWGDISGSTLLDTQSPTTKIAEDFDPLSHLIRRQE